jgi:3-oxoacyl-[acyl-carrier protein] reductase
MDLGLKGKVALVTGVASQVGIGKAIALALAEEGCDIIGADIDLKGAQKTGDEIKALGRRALIIKVDITKNTEVRDMVQSAMKEFGRIDILVNNAGGTTFSGPLAEAKQEDIDKEINLNLNGVIYCTKAVLPVMIAQKSGKILNMSALAGRSAAPGGSGYTAAKAGIIGFTRAIAMEAGPSGINVNALAPGLILTNFYGGEGAPKLPPQMRSSSENPMAPTRRNTTTEDIANAVLFLVSDKSKNITGQTISVDGGQMMP